MPPADAYPLLHGIRVLDASRVLAGPFCGQLLGDLGAEVIKVERPGSGDETRTWGPPFLGELSAYFLSCNRNKESITLDLGSAEGVDIFHRLAAKSDILLENFRTSSAVRLGLSTEKLLEINPRLVVCSITGFGRTGPFSELPGYDFAIQALSGLMSITGPAEGPPYKVGVAVTDVLTGLYAAVAVLACVRAREKSGHGYAIDLALLDCAVSAQVNVAQAFLTGGSVPPRQGNAHLQIVPYQLFATADAWIVLAVGNDGQWQRFCRAAGQEELGVDSRFAVNAQRVANRNILVPMLEKILQRKTTATWEKLFTGANVPNAAILDYASLFSHPQATDRGLRVTVRDPNGQAVDLLGTPFHIAGTNLIPPTAPPGLGAQTNSVLERLLGMDARTLENLRYQSVI